MRNLKTEDKDFWDELEQGKVLTPAEDELVAEDNKDDEDGVDDDCTVTCSDVAQHVLFGTLTDGITTAPNGKLTTEESHAESTEPEAKYREEDQMEAFVDRGPGKRKIRKHHLIYNDQMWPGVRNF